MRAAALTLVGALALPTLAMPTRAGPTDERVEIDGFAIDRTEVTVARFRAFATATARISAAEKEGGGFEYQGGWVRRPGWTWAAPSGRTAQDSEPVTHVSWFEARDYCAHVGGRLPSSAEWTRAAYTETRATPADGFVRGRTYGYPVGDSPEGMNNNRSGHVPAGTSKPGVNGLYDMGGNVWEWLADRRAEQAMTAGGSWWYGPEVTRADAAQWKPADFYVIYIGFRCAYDIRR